jgi:tripartite-type tricarboxylate transporter receptor subunit TctC
MPAGGGIGLANHLYSAAPRDGTVIGTVPREIATAPYMGASAARFDPTKFGWIGTPTTETNACLTHARTQIRTYKDLYEKELIVGDAGAGNGIHVYPTALKALFGLKFKLVPGYSTSAEIFLALERGEVDGVCVSYDSVLERYADWIADGRLRVLLQGGAAPNPLLPDVPFAPDLARDEGERRVLKFLYSGQGIGRPYAAPPGVPEERLAALREAFDSTMKDPDFVAEAKRAKLRLDPIGGRKLAELVEELAKTPEDTRELARKFLD